MASHGPANAGARPHPSEGLGLSAQPHRADRDTTGALVTPFYRPRPSAHRKPPPSAVLMTPQFAERTQLAMRLLGPFQGVAGAASRASPWLHPQRFGGDCRGPPRGVAGPRAKGVAASSTGAPGPWPAACLTSPAPPWPRCLPGSCFRGHKGIKSFTWHVLGRASPCGSCVLWPGREGSDRRICLLRHRSVKTHRAACPLLRPLRRCVVFCGRPQFVSRATRQRTGTWVVSRFGPPRINRLGHQLAHRWVCPGPLCRVGTEQTPRLTLEQALAASPCIIEQALCSLDTVSWATRKGHLGLSARNL